MRTLLILFLTFISTKLVGQNRGNIWELGDHGLSQYPACYIHFYQGSADTVTIYRQMNFFITNAGICDSNGQLLFYTNGVYIANKNHDSLFNSKDFNPGYWTDFYGEGGMGIPQSELILPMPGHSEDYGVFSVSGELGNFYGKTFASLYLSYSEVNMNLDSGLGGIVSNKKNIHLVEDTLLWGRLTACRHANGRDWWIISHKFHSNQYYKLLFTPDTILTTEQKIGNNFTSFDANGMAIFSPNGSRYAHLNINDTIDLLEFDRCSGEFSNPIYLTVPDTPATFSATLGCQFSPNSHFLYINSYQRLWQFDIWAADVEASRILIDSTDNFEDKFLQQLAPDGKIYISSFNSDCQHPVLHLINQPDSLGIVCNFLIDGFALPPVCNSNVPNLPNYDLGPLAGSSCDTLNTTATVVQINQSFHLFPNPANNFVYLNYSLKDEAQLVVTDAFGNVAYVTKLYPWFKTLMIHLNGFAAGIYLASITQNGITIASQKLVIEK